MEALCIGVLVNPLAGVGGPFALKGSDDLAAVLAVLNGKLPTRAGERMREVLAALLALQSSELSVSFKTVEGLLGGQWCQGFPVEIIEMPDAVSADALPSEADFVSGVNILEQSDIDLLLFAGGDGTARLVVDALESEVPVLGIPAGVKMHSGVFAVSVKDTIALLADFFNGALTQVVQREIRDLDEMKYRVGEVATQYYGELWVPAALKYVQATKVSGLESDDLVKIEIGAFCQETLAPNNTVILGPGSTTLAVKQALCGEGTLLGMDVIRNGVCVVSDANEEQLWDVVSHQKGVELVLGVTGAQGMVMGRGNQQLSSRVLTHLSPEQWTVVATKSKLKHLSQPHLRLDLDCPKQRERWSGAKSVGWIRRLGAHADFLKDALGEILSS